MTNYIEELKSFQRDQASWISSFNFQDIKGFCEINYYCVVDKKKVYVIHKSIGINADEELIVDWIEQLNRKGRISWSPESNDWLNVQFDRRDWLIDWFRLRIRVSIIWRRCFFYSFTLGSRKNCIFVVVSSLRLITLFFDCSLC